MAAQRLFTPTKVQTTDAALTSQAIAERLEQAKAKAEAAERDYRREAFLALQGNAASDETAAEARRDAALREVAKLEAILIEAKTQEAEAEKAAKAAAEAAEDAEMVEAFEEQAKAAEALAPILDSYAEAYLALCYAADRVRGLARNPRAPRGLDVQNTEDLVGTELARVARVMQPLLPGASEWVMVAHDRTKLKPLAQHFRDLADMLRETMGHG